MTKRGNFQCLAPANHFCSGGILFFLLAWATFAILVVTVLGLENKLSACNMRCYSPTFCWQSITLTPPSMCAGDATKCFNKCTPEMVAKDGSSECRQVNQCDEIYFEENEKINACTSVCTLENKVVNKPIAFPLGVLLLLLMGTISLNFLPRVRRMSSQMYQTMVSGGAWARSSIW